MKGAFLIRHGESEHHVNGMLGGWYDLPLTELGRRQAVRVAERLAGMRLSDELKVYSSDLTRAAETASIIGERLGVEVRLDSGLRELNNGGATGLSLAEAEAIQLARTEPIEEWIPYDGADSWHAMARRVFECMDRIESEGCSKPIIVGHGGSLAAVVRWWIGPSWSSSRMWEFWFAAASYTSLDTNVFGQRQVERLNETSHLVG